MADGKWQMTNRLKKFFFLFLLSSIFFLTPAFSQENIFTVGFQYKPMLVSSFFNTAKRSLTQNNINFSVGQQSGYCAGMIIRRGFKKNISMEFGINYVKRNYKLEIQDTTFSGKSTFTIIGYEIPVMGMIFLRVAKKVFMTTGFGLSCDMYPSSIYTKDTYFEHLSNRHSVFQSAVLANLGYEFRSDKNGIFNLGFSYHLPFTSIFISNVKYLPTSDIVQLKLPGNYLTIDFRYFFHEDPMKPKKEKKKK